MPTLPGQAQQYRPERRRFTRHAFDANLPIEWGSAVIEGRVRDISAEGMFIELPDPLWVGARFMAKLSLEPPLELECVVRRVEPGRGMGVHFSLEKTEARERLQTLLDSIAGR